MNLISIDAGYFQSYVHEIFKDQNWELRYQGLDNLFGLFTKMDTIFQTEWLKLLCHLGPMFSFFVQSLWDNEDKVRSKALTLIRTFNTLHLRSAFRCWEAYFLTASDEQKKTLIQQMMQLNAIFPDWQVLEWGSLLEALERESYIVVSDDPIHTPLNYNLLKDEIQSDKEIQNLKLLLIMLALQMLSNHLKPTHEQIFRLKLILVQQMGFQNCHYFNNAGEISVEFDHLRYDPNDSLQVASMICCVRSLKKVMDSFAPLPAETIALMVSQSVEHGKLNLSENTSPGIYFLDVVFKMLNSGIDLAQLGNLMLRTWLETFLIVIYKHNILEPRYERDIVSSMKVVIELLNLDIGEENKLLILEILKCLLRRSDHLTAMVLSKQIMALGKILTKHGLKHSDPVLLKAKQFLKSAFLRFAVAGLFVLLFKNQPVHDDNNKKVDLFFVLRTVIDPEDIVPDEDIHGEHVYLYDQPVRDVLDKLMKQQMDRKAFSNVLYNTCRYVEVVHSHPYSLSILNELPNFLNTLIKHTSDWRRSDWDINPVLSMSAILLKEHPYQYSSLLSPIQAVFKYGLHDCMIQPEAVARLLIAYSLITSVPDVPPVNPFVDIILEETKNYLLGLNRPNKETMLMLLQVIYWDLTPSGQAWYMEISKSAFNNSNEHASYFELKLKNILPQMVHFLKLPSSSQPFTKRDFKVYSITSQLVAYSCTKDPNEMTRILGFLKLEETPECLRFLNWFILALLKSKSSQTLLSMLRYENVITDLLTQTLNSVKIDFHNPSPNFLYSRVNEVLLLCFLLTKTWAILKMKCKSLGEEQGINQVFFWLSIWPSLRRLLEAIEPSTLFIIEEISSDVFIGQEHDADQVVVIANFKRQVTKIRTMLDVPPAEAPLALLVDQLRMELREIMRLEVETIITHGVNRELTLPDASYAVRL
ncbi:hypothetical protein BCV71DRAFT_175808 [Rhizopus microsporus]|uniref:Uncharacterized protein n=1 Tax=Rhizopus microsporus TaxID=58291 RepID=A0A1X0S7Y4_RHIZD|nr:hypothetical protein BCV71DRAFT_175808 [Rhizopus microsporus]